MEDHADTMDTIENSTVAKVFANYPEAVRAKLLLLRQLILETARETENAGAVEETLKWGQPGLMK